MLKLLSKNLMINSIRINGFRGFAQEQILGFAQPNGEPGSGMTIVVGANNSGKSTVIESLRAISHATPSSFSQGRRNATAGDQVSIQLITQSATVTLKSTRAGGSETDRLIDPDNGWKTNIFLLPSHRVFAPYFGKAEHSRDQHLNQMRLPNARESVVGEFTHRLFLADKNKDKFNQVMKELIDPVPNWTIDQSDNGQYFLKLSKGTATHSSEGVGEGLISVLFIVDALYDSAEGDCIVIDEPELSLHPALQRKLVKLLAKYAATRQIVISTHSPYFVDLAALAYGATIARVHVKNHQTQISQLQANTAARIKGVLEDQNQPHTLGLNAQEVFFLEDHIILVEGQEDVVFYRRVLDDLGVDLKGEFFGWGVGGAEKMQIIASVLKDIGFSKVVGILDADKSNVRDELQAQFPDFKFLCIPANDVRTKKSRAAVDAKLGLLDDRNQHIRAEYVEATKAVIVNSNHYMDAQ